MRTRLTRHRLSRHFAALAVSCTALGLGAAHAATVSYTALGTFTTATVTTGGVTVTGSNTIHVLNLNGLGIVGGAFDNTVDGSEFLDFDFSGLGSAVNLSYFVGSAGNLDSDNVSGTRTLSVFGVGGTLLGNFSQEDTGLFDVSTLVGNTPIGRIRLQADVDSFRLGEISFDAQRVEPAPVPAPATAPLLLAGLGVAAALRGRRRSRARTA